MEIGALKGRKDNRKELEPKEVKECTKGKEKDTKAKEFTKARANERAKGYEGKGKGMKGKGKGQGCFLCGDPSHWRKAKKDVSRD